MSRRLGARFADAGFTRLWLIVGTGVLALSCSGDASVPTGGFDDYFEVIGRFSLQDDADVPLGSIGAFVETSTGDLLIGDALIPRVRRYDAGGRLLREFGTDGDGPFEFRRIGGLVEDLSGKVIIVDPGLARLTVLSGEFAPDTILQVNPRPVGSIHRLGRGYLLATAPQRRTSALTWMTSKWQPVWSLPLDRAEMSNISKYPYWGSYAVTRLAVGSKLLVAAISLFYPLYVYDARGAVIDSITAAPESFRVVSVVEEGAFVGVGGTERRERWLDSFDVITSLSIIADSLLVVAHGVEKLTPETGRVWTVDDRLDVYDLRSRTKLAEDIRVPEDVQVLAGGRHGLYLLADEPPDPWTVLHVRFQPPVE